MYRASGIGISIFLIAVGAVLYFAVSASVTGLSLGAVGVILMIVGALGLVVSIAMSLSAVGRDGRTTVVQGTTPVQGSTTVIHDDVR
jgi:hypothetical protein